MSVMSIVFSQMFKFKVEGINYLVYLMTGLIMFNYFSQASNMSMTSVVENFGLINKVYIPKYIFPISKCLFVGINFLFTLIPWFAIILLSFVGLGQYHASINWLYLLLPIIFLCLFMFTLGIGMIVSCVSVFLRDMFYIYGIILTIWQYFTPIFYDIRMLPEQLQSIFRLNPLYVFITSAREIILFSKMPDPYLLISSGVFGVVMLLIGVHFFRKKQDEFIYHI